MNQMKIMQPVATCLLLALLSGAVQAHGREHPAPSIGKPMQIKRTASDTVKGLAIDRMELLRKGEAALAAGNADAAIDAFEQAGNLKHAADSETGLVRALMQAGLYRQALAFIAHTAGVHPDEPTGPALYAWLLHIGGQDAAAQQILHNAEKRLPGKPLLSEVAGQLRSALPDGAMLQHAGTVRFQPYDSSGQLPAKLPDNATVASSGTLIGDGRFALVPLEVVKDTGSIWVRNGLGQLRKATVDGAFDAEGLALLKLDTPLPMPADAATVERDPFPGSVGYAVEYVASGRRDPAWPVLKAGFLGSPIGLGPDRKLGIELPAGPRGGAVFDAAGRLAGIAVPGTAGPDKLIPMSRLRERLGAVLENASTSSAQTVTKVSVDTVYEAAMRMTVQVLVTH